MSALGVLLPIHDGEATLAGTLASLAPCAASGAVSEVVAVDDGSTDRTARILEEWAGRLPLRVLRHPARRGRAAAVNTAIDASRAEALWILDDDMTVRPETSVEHLRLLAERRGCASVGEARPEGDPAAPAVAIARRLHQRTQGTWPDRKELSFSACSTGNFAIRRETLGAVRFDSSFQAYGFEDFELGWRLRAAGIPLVLNRRAWAAHRLGEVPLAELERKRLEAGRNLPLLLERHPDPEEALRSLGLRRSSVHRLLRKAVVNPATLPVLRPLASLLSRVSPAASAAVYDRILGDAFYRGWKAGGR